jgi:glycosyltransferase involved in cell wall biosynthesis
VEADWNRRNTSPEVNVIALEASIIIATRNRAASLARCLESLLEDPSTAAREIVVVDNGSSDDTQFVIERTSRDASLPVHHLIEHRRGHSNARNRGVAHARGQFLLFTDDDVTVSPGWVDAHLDVLEIEGVGGAGGRILPCWESPRPHWLDGPQASALELFDYGLESFDMGPGKLPLGANMSVRRDAARSINPLFDPRLGHNGRVAMGGEEFYLFARIIRSGRRVVYSPDAAVWHHIPNDRVDWASIRRHVFQVGFGIARMERLLGTNEQLSLARRAVRAARVCRGAWHTKRLNERRAPTAAEANDEFQGFLWAGLHLEMLFGRSRAFANFLAERLT